MGNHFNTLDNKPGDFQIFKFGLNPDIDSGSVPEDIWPIGGQLQDEKIVPPITFVSTDAQDTAAGNGMRELFVQGIDDNGNYKESTHATNGLTSVNIGNYLFINRAFGTKWGPNRRNIGNINFTDSAGTPQTLAQIPVSTLVTGFGLGQTLQAIYCVPLDFGPMRIIQRWAAVGKQQATQAAIIISFNQHGVLVPESGFTTSSTIETNTQGSSFLNQDTRLNLVVDPLTIVRLTVAEVTTTNTRISGGFSLAKTSP